MTAARIADRLAQPVTSPTGGKMSLASVTRGKVERPFKAVVYGPAGCGKSTFAADAPAPIFLCTEAGTDNLDVARFPAPDTFGDCLEAVRVLMAERHDYKTLVVDTLDAMQPLLWAHVAKMGGKADIEAWGFGKGFVYVADAWRDFLKRLDALIRARGMHVILIAHSQVRKHDDPTLPNAFDRYEMKLHKEATALVAEWTDNLLFARYETFANASKGAKAKGISTGARLLHTSWTAAYDAKSRLSLPEVLPLSWEAFAEAARAGTPAPTDELIEAVSALVLRTPDDKHAGLFAALEARRSDAIALAKMKDHLTAKLGPAEQPKEENAP